MKSKRYPEIDLLRGVACLMVVAFHYLYRGQQGGWLMDQPVQWLGALASYGYLGVHLFFMISGFVIFMSAEGVSTRDFFSSRVSRLYPVLWVGVLLTSLVTYLFSSPHFQVGWLQLLSNLTMVPHWMRMDYVDGAYWSLAVELQFYILIGCMVWLKQLRRAEWVMAAWLLIGTVNAVRRIYFLEFWLVAQWASLFVAGMIFYRSSREGWTRARLGLMIWCYALSMNYVINPASNDHTVVNGFQRPGVMIALALLTSFYLVFLAMTKQWLSVAGSSVILWMGVLTYPVYILHQNIGYTLLEIGGWRGVDFQLRALIVLTGVVAAAWAVNRFLERPVSRWLRGWTRQATPGSRRS